MPYVRALQCRECKRQYPIQPLHVCEYCLGPLEVLYDYDAIARVISRERLQRGPPTMWRYTDLLPVDGEAVVDLHTGFTPFLKAHNLGRLLGLENLYLKNDAVNPSYSFKDRVVGVASTKALEFGFDTLACASTGNLAGSVAAHAARARMKAFIFIPADLEQGKIVGAAIYGPTVVAVKGSYDDVNRLCVELADTYPWAFVNITMRPYYAEGSKTLAFEVAEQLGWRLPDHCIVPVASGSLLTKIWKGFQEFVDLGLVPGPMDTRIHAAQPAGCCPVVQAFHAGALSVRPVQPRTIAKSLAIGNPADGVAALKVLRASGGTAVAVPEEEVAEGIALLAQTEGLFTETAGGVVISALKRLVQQGVIRRDEVVVAYLTGNGLKTQEAVEHVIRLLVVEPTVASFQKALNGL